MDTWEEYVGFVFPKNDNFVQRGLLLRKRTKHATSKDMNVGQTRWSTLVSNAISREARASLEKSKAVAKVATSALDNGRDAINAALPEMRHIRKQTDFEIYRAQQLREGGRPGGHAHHEFHTSPVFDRLPLT